MAIAIATVLNKAANGPHLQTAEPYPIQTRFGGKGTSSATPQSSLLPRKSLPNRSLYCSRLLPPFAPSQKCELCAYRSTQTMPSGASPVMMRAVTSRVLRSITETVLAFTSLTYAWEPSGDIRA